MSAEGREGIEDSPIPPQYQVAVPGRVSVVIPAYNAAATIGAAIESCLAQDHPGVEVIVVDDGSTDGTPDVLLGFGNRIVVVAQANAGLAAARNAGQRAATGEFIAWMDADDLMVPSRVRVGAEVLRRCPEVNLVSSDFSAFTDPESDCDPSHWATYYSAVGRLGGMAAVFPEALPPVELDGRSLAVRSGVVYESLLWGNFIHPPTVITRRTALEAAGWSDSSLRYSSDYDLILRLARQGPFAFVDAPLLRYRRSPGQMSHVNAGVTMQLETIRILDNVRTTDPDVAVRLDGLFRRRRAESFIAVADHIGPSDRVRAMSHLMDGLRSKVLAAPALLALGRIATTPAMVQAMKHALRAVGIRWAVLLAAASSADAWPGLAVALADLA